MTVLLQVDTPDPNRVGPGLIAFVVVALLAVATWLLIRSMRNQMRKVPPSFDDESQAPQPPADPPTDRQSS